MKTKCEHYWEWGYTLEPTIYCIKCDKEWWQVGIDPKVIRLCEVIDGKFKKK